MVAMAKKAWFALMNWKTRTGSPRSPVRTRLLPLPGYRAPGAVAGSHAADGSAPRARRWSGRPVGGLRRDRPDEPSSRSPGQSVRTRATAPPVFAQIGPDQPFVAGIPEHRVGDSSASMAPPSQVERCRPNRVNSSQTEDDLIWPVLSRLGWTESLRQQNLAPRGREDVPDGLLFGESAAKARANTFPEEWRRYEFGLAVVESKRWRRPLDRRSGRRGEETAPSTQMLRYLRRVEDLTTGKLRWGILTNGGQWRLYYQGARSVSEQFFEIDLAMVLAISGHDGGLFALSEQECRHWLKVFALVFGRAAFLPTPS